MAAEAAVLLWGLVRRIATISRRIVVVATFFIYNIDAMPVLIASVARFGKAACLVIP